MAKIIGRIYPCCPYCGVEHEIEIDEEQYEEELKCNGCGDEFRIEYDTESANATITGMIHMSED